MKEARSLLIWNRVRQECSRIEEKLALLKAEERELMERRRAAEQKITSIGTPSDDDIDGKINLALAQQELWLVNKDEERFFERRFTEESSLREKKREKEAEAKRYKAALSADTLALYHRVIDLIPDNPVVEVRRRSCMGCYLPLSAAQMEEWERGRRLIVCGECGRILV
ncbi:hypothetical protein DFP93_11329 [Aneurinibacillus soli]|uniref:Putative zinc ribbon domain protein n=1 Tax=Aneurinibacillus soli TaxID=1500254 RepID=A0A0U5B1U6_9BACL|nr:hypothetical protein [Aneurinibacillus soli]PYE60321.1 hypothetical protein DFP93_11329 [Aneurinibacillus soli]BAU27279.1 putative zinc ribbon domain protein [Aneurinibacillus soli]